MRPFEGVTILDFSHVLTGPYASSLLALCGARVIKIEQPGIGDLIRKGSDNAVLAGRGLSPGFQAVNVGKEAITIDLKSEQGVAIVKQLAARADVVLENFRPGVLDRLGVGQRQLSAVNPALIYCAITGFGHHIVYLSNYLNTDSRYYEMSHEELLEEYLPHIRKINPQFDLSWVKTSYHHRVDAAQPIIGTDYSSRMPEHRTPFRGVYLANTTQVYPEDRGTNYSVRMGREVARMVMEDFA